MNCTVSGGVPKLERIKRVESVNDRDITVYCTLTPKEVKIQVKFNVHDCKVGVRDPQKTKRGVVRVQR